MPRMTIRIGVFVFLLLAHLSSERSNGREHATRNFKLWGSVVLEERFYVEKFVIDKHFALFLPWSSLWSFLLSLCKISWSLRKSLSQFWVDLYAFCIFFTLLLRKMQQSYCRQTNGESAKLGLKPKSKTKLYFQVLLLNTLNVILIKTVEL